MSQWTKEMIDAHNQRVAQGRSARCQDIQPKPPKVDLVLKPTTDESRLNKLERLWLCHLRLMRYPWIGVQCWTFKLGDDCRYQPDFIGIGFNGELFAWETKGFMRDDALVKLKAAARMYPFIRFVLVRRVKGNWQDQEINP